MSHPEQVAAFVEDLEKVVDRYRQEFDLPLASVLGSLEALKLHLFVTERETHIDDESDSTHDP